MTTIVIADDPRRRKCFWDNHLTVLKDGSLLDTIFVDDRDRPGKSEIYAARSTDGVQRSACSFCAASRAARAGFIAMRSCFVMARPSCMP